MLMIYVMSHLFFCNDVSNEEKSFATTFYVLIKTSAYFSQIKLYWRDNGFQPQIYTNNMVYILNLKGPPHD